jgi:hypothetical protein
MRKELIEKHVLEIQDKYFRLVWYARKDVEKLKQEGREDILNSIKEIETLYPEETESLKGYETGDWEHGFNSGVLAGLRFVLTLIDKHGGYEEAMEQFPELDT